MKIARIHVKTGDYDSYSVFSGDQYLLIKDPFSEMIEYTGERVDVDDARLLCPCVPSKIVCVGVNYSEHAAEMSHELPEEPIIFLKPPSSVIGPGETIIYPPQSQRVDYEAELAVVIKTQCSNVSADDAARYVLGYTCLNDVTARDIQSRDGQWTRAKSFDTFCAIGPMIETDYDWRDQHVRSLLNGNVKQDGRTSMMIRGVDELISFVSGVMTLMPGDVIATGTPSGIGPMQRGDVIEVDIGGLGVLCNRLA